MKITELAILSGAKFEFYLPCKLIDGVLPENHFAGYVMGADELKQFSELVIIAHCSKMLG